MSFPDPQPQPPFVPPFSQGDIVGFWPQIPLNDEDMDSHSQFDHGPLFKKPRNFGNNPANSTPFPPMNPRIMNLTNPPINRGTGHIFYKTRMCLKFLEGNCRNGEHCTFAHGPEDLREPPPNWQEIVGARDKDKGPGNWNDDQRMVHKMKICKRFYNGEECPYGDKCNFLHEQKFKTEMGSPRESSAISIGTTGSMVGNRSVSDQFEVNTNKHVNASSDDFRDYMKPTYWKTKLCIKWETTGQCPFGERCHFAHGLSELQAPGGHIEAEAVNTLSIPTKPVLVPANDVVAPSRTVVCAPAKEDVKGKKCFPKWKGAKKIDRIYADWIDDLTPPLSLPNKVQS